MGPSWIFVGESCSGYNLPQLQWVPVIRKGVLVQKLMGLDREFGSIHLNRKGVVVAG
jgi:hypothetical protein